MCRTYLPSIAKKVALITIVALFFCVNNLKADHFWIFNNLEFVENPVGSGIYDLRFEYTTNGATTNNVYYEIYVIEDGCIATDGFSFDDTGCISYVNRPSRTETITVDANVPFCPGKKYAAVLFTRRMRGGNTPCSPNDRANSATPQGQLTKYPNISPGDPANIWDGAPQQFNAMNTYPAGSGSDGPNTTDYDGNWAYIYTTQTGNGDPLWNLDVQITTEDCIADNDVDVMYNSDDNADVLMEDLGSNVVRCGSQIDVSYQSDNTCGTDFPGNTFELTDNTTVIDVVNYSSSNVTPQGPDVNVDGRFETIDAQFVGFACSSGDVDLNLTTAGCNTEVPVDIQVTYTLEVLYPTSNFVEPEQVNCSDMCGQDLIMRDGPEWQTAGLNMGTSTTLPTTADVGTNNYTWSGQVCTPIEAGSATDCLDGQGNVYVDNCASCGVYDIEYEIANVNCPECSTTTTKQVQIVSPVITNVQVKEMELCDAGIPEISFDVEACTPATGAASGNPYTGDGEKFWTRSDGSATDFIPEGSVDLMVMPGETITFTPHFRNNACESCNAVGTPVTVTVFEETTPPTNGNTTTQICEDGTANLMATCAACASGSTPTVNWFSNATGGTAIATTAAYNPANGDTAEQGAYDNSAPGFYTFYAECVCDDCPSTRVPYTVEVVEEPITPVATDIHVECSISSSGTVSLSQLFPNTDMTPANFTSNGANPATIVGGAVVFTEPGCYCVDYNYTEAPCPAVGPVTSCVLVSQQPQPSFDIQDQVCYSDGDAAIALAPTVNSPSYSVPVDREWSVSGPATINPSTGVVSVTGTGVITVTLEETIDYAACATVAAGSCSTTFETTITVEDGTALDPSFTVSDMEPCLNAAVTLTPATDGGVFTGINVTDNGSGTGGTFTATECGTYAVTYTINSPNGCTNTQTINITTDQTAPALTVPADATFECDGSGNTADIAGFVGGFSATDNCAVTASSSEVAGEVETCGNTKVITYKFEAEDACGNIATEYATITIEDTTDPIINAPADITVDCSDLENTDPTAGQGPMQIGAGARTTCANTTVGYTPTTGMPFPELPFVADLETCVCAYDAAGNLDMQISGATACPTAVAGTGTFNMTFTTAPLGGGGAPCIYGQIALLTDPGDGAALTIGGWLDGATSGDVCGNTTVTNNFNLASFSNECGNTGTQTVTFTTTDECGNTATTTSTITIEDNNDPILTTPEGITVECNDGNTDAIVQNWLDSASAIDTCSNVTISNDFTVLPECGMSVTVTFTATDECDNEVTGTAMITLEDTEKPVFVNAPQDLILECDGTADPSGEIATWLTNFGGAIATDACDDDVTITPVAGTAVVECAGSSITPYEFTAEDDCGNSIVETAYVRIVDNTPPTITVAADPGPVACQAANPLLWAGTMGATATDICSDATITAVVSGQTETCPGNTTYTILFTAIDECGNTSTETGTYTTVDNVGPTFLEAPTDLTLTCGDDIGTAVSTWLFDIAVEDACSSYSTLTNDFSGDVGSLCGPTTIPVVWTATDLCGNSNTTTANIIITEDMTPPTFDNCPSDMTVSVGQGGCEANVIYSTPTASDCNAPATVSLTSGPASGTTFMLGANAIVFTAIDACGNESTCEFTITVVDDAPPTANCPSDITVCNTEDDCVWTNNTSTDIMAVDECPTLTITHEVTGATTVAAGTAGNVSTDFELGTSTVIYTINDGTNTTTCSFNVTVQDCQAPTITCPTAITEECGDDNSAAITAFEMGAVVADNCTTPPTTTFEVVSTSFNCGNSTTTTYRFITTDDAGNTAECFSTITTEDTTAPVIADNAADVTVECDGTGNDADLLAFLNSNGGILPTDITESCGLDQIVNNFTSSTFTPAAGCAGTGFYDVEFIAIDLCGNQSAPITVRLIVEDTEDPMFTAPSNITLECGDGNNDAIVNNWLQSYTTSDVCSIVSVTNDYTALPTTCDGDITVTFTATDECMNDVEATATITFMDGTKPVVMTPPTDLILECPADMVDITTWTDNFGGMVANDACDTDVTLSFVAGTPTGACGSNEVTPYTFTATDDCGNAVSEIAYLRTVDTTDPTLTPPTAGTSTDCAADPLTLINPWLATAMATDDCDMAPNTTSALISENTACVGMNTATTYTYVFTATDACGNQTTGTSTYTITDDVAPTITPPADLSLECGDDISLNVLDWLDNYSVVEACQVTSVSNSFDASAVDLCGSTTPVTWTVVDECGAIGTAMANIIIQADTEDPIFLNCPTQDIIVNVNTADCQARVNYPTPVAEDCNSPVTVTAAASNIASGGVFPLGTTAISFEAEDACGNTATCSFNIIVEDNDTPTIACPSDITVCNDDGVCTFDATTVLDPFFNENCTGATLTYSVTGVTTAMSAATGFNTVSADNVTFELGESTVTYSTTDAAGNMATCTFNVTVEDCEAPIVTCPVDITLECADAGNAAAITAFETGGTATDNCDMDVATSTVIFSSDTNCGATSVTTYIFTATDEAGNTSTCTATITIEDTTPPTIVAGTDGTAECDGNGNWRSDCDIHSYR